MTLDMNKLGLSVHVVTGETGKMQKVVKSKNRPYLNHGRVIAACH
jgi:hypothetical protein